MQRRGGMKVSSSEALDAGCMLADVEVWRHGALEVRCRHVDVEVWSAEVEACCGPGDAETCRYGVLELWRRVADA